MGGEAGVWGGGGGGEGVSLDLSATTPDVQHSQQLARNKQK